MRAGNTLEMTLRGRVRDTLLVGHCDVLLYCNLKQGENFCVPSLSDIRGSSRRRFACSSHWLGNDQNHTHSNVLSEPSKYKLSAAEPRIDVLFRPLFVLMPSLQDRSLVPTKTFRTPLRQFANRFVRTNGHVESKWSKRLTDGKVLPWTNELRMRLFLSKLLCRKISCGRTDSNPRVISFPPPFLNSPFETPFLSLRIAMP